MSNIGQLVSYEGKPYMIVAEDGKETCDIVREEQYLAYMKTGIDTATSLLKTVDVDGGNTYIIDDATGERVGFVGIPYSDTQEI